MKCYKCHKEIEKYHIQDGIRYYTGARDVCLACVPFGPPREVANCKCLICDETYYKLANHCKNKCPKCAQKQYRKNILPALIFRKGGKCFVCYTNQSVELYPKISPKSFRQGIEQTKNCILLCDKCLGKVNRKEIEIPENVSQLNMRQIVYNSLINRFQVCPTCCEYLNVARMVT